MRAFAAEEPVAAHAPAPAPVAEEPVPAPVAGPAWPEDEIVTEPGRPLPGEVDGGWSGAAKPVAAAGPAWVEEAAAAAPVEEVEWIGADPAAEEEIRSGARRRGRGAAWQPPADEVPEWEAAQQEVPEWEAPAPPAAEEEPVQEPTAWEPGPDMPSWQPDEDAEQPDRRVRRPGPEVAAAGVRPGVLR